MNPDPPGNPLLQLLAQAQQFLGRMTQPADAQGFLGTRYANPLLAEHVVPMDYPASVGEFLRLGTRGTPLSVYGADHEVDPVSEDAWRMYLGQPQKRGTLEPSPYRPTNASNPDAAYYRVPGLVQQLLMPDPMTTGGDPELEALSRQIRMRNLIERADSDDPIINLDGPTNTYAFRHATVSRGEDERGHYLSFWDVYDLDVPGEREGRGFGRPFEIYDRIYYDPETLDLIEDDQ